MLQSQIPDWLSDEVLSLPITNGHETPPSPASHSTRPELNEREPISSVGDPDANTLGNHPTIQVRYRVQS